jgi:diacylglycerol kinase family enzyme
VQEHVVTLLNRLQEPHKVWTTTAPRHAGDIARTILSEVADRAGVVKVVVAGGDGTAHELIEGIKSSGLQAGSPGIRWELVILPLGTVRSLSRGDARYAKDLRPTLYMLRCSQAENRLYLRAWKA